MKRMLGGRHRGYGPVGTLFLYRSEAFAHGRTHQSYQDLTVPFSV